MPSMSRKATPKRPEVDTAIEQISHFCSFAQTNINELAEIAGVQQSALWRFMEGQRKTLTETANKVLGYINNWHKCHNLKSVPHGTDEYEQGRRIIENAALSLWDGDPKTAKRSASLILALKPIIDLANSSEQRDASD